MQAKGADLSNAGNERRLHDWRQRESHRSMCSVDKATSRGTQADSSDTAATCPWQSWAIKWMAGRWWEPGFSLSEWEFTDKERRLQWSTGRHQCELPFRLLWIQVFTYGIVYWGVYTHQVGKHTYVPLLSDERAWQTWHPVAMSTQILAYYTTFQWKEPGFLREMADSRAGPETYKISLVYLIVPEIRKCSNMGVGGTPHWWEYVRKAQSQSNELPMAETRTIWVKKSSRIA